MSDVDILIKEKLLPLRKKALNTLAEKHPYIFSVVNRFLQGKSNKAGLIVTEQGKTVGEYTFLLDGMHVADVKTGVLESEIHHPFGVFKPYGIMEKSVLEKALEDEQAFIDEPFHAIRKYMPDITIKFLR